MGANFEIVNVVNHAYTPLKIPRNQLLGRAESFSEDGLTRLQNPANYMLLSATGLLPEFMGDVNYSVSWEGADLEKAESIFSAKDSLRPVIRTPPVSSDREKQPADVAVESDAREVPTPEAMREGLRPDLKIGIERGRHTREHKIEYGVHVYDRSPEFVKRISDLVNEYSEVFRPKTDTIQMPEDQFLRADLVEG